MGESIECNSKSRQDQKARIDRQTKRPVEKEEEMGGCSGTNLNWLSNYTEQVMLCHITVDKVWLLGGGSRPITTKSDLESSWYPIVPTTSVSVWYYRKASHMDGADDLKLIGPRGCLSGIKAVTSIWPQISVVFTWTEIFKMTCVMAKA